MSSLFPTILQPPITTSGSAANNGTASTVNQPDSSTLSPATSFLNQLQQLEQQSPTQFQQMLSEITSRLEQAATAAQNSGNNTQATALSNLATAFQGAEKGGALPTAQQLQQAGLTSHHHHGHHGGGSSLLSQLETSDSSNSQTLAASIFGSTSPSGS